MCWKHLIFILVLIGVEKPLWAIPNFKPDWMKSKFCEQLNGSYLNDLKNNPDIFSTSLNDQIFVDSGYSNQKRREYENLFNEYELKQKSGILDAADKEAYDNKTRLSKSTMDDMSRQQQNKKMGEIRTGLDRVGKQYSFVKILKKPFVMIAGIYAFFLRGQPVNMKVSEKTEIIAKSDLKTNRGEVQVSSSALQGGVVYVGKAPVERNPFDPPPQDSLQKEERLKLSVSRGIPLIDVKSSLSYGATTSSVTAGLEKQLTKHLSCSMDAMRSSKYLNSVQRNGDETIKFIYSINF